MCFRRAPCGPEKNDARANGRAASRRRVVHFSIRSFSFTELRDWLLDAGLSSVDVSGQEGEPLDLQVRWMVVVATR